jgi:hypothetical protein
MISVRGMAQLVEWNQGHTFPREDSFSLACTMISAAGMARLGEWSRLRNQGQLFFYAWEEYSRYPTADVLLYEGR